MEAFPSLPNKHYRELRHEIRSGDILLCSGHSVFSTLIKKATGSIWSHIGFILRVDAIDRIMVLESVESIAYAPFRLAIMCAITMVLGMLIQAPSCSHVIKMLSRRISLNYHALPLTCLAILIGQKKLFTLQPA